MPSFKNRLNENTESKKTFRSISMTNVDIAFSTIKDENVHRFALREREREK